MATRNSRQSALVSLAIALAFAAAFLCLNIVTSLHRAPWIDEIMQIDAGVNLHLGHGWRSTTWSSESSTGFWAANTPLHALLVAAWVHVLGFTPVMTRCLDYVLTCLFTGVVIVTARRAGAIQTRWASLLLAILLIGDASIVYVYRGGRADVVIMLIAACTSAAYLDNGDPRRRRVLLFCCGMLFCPAGIQTIFFVGLLLVIDFIMTRRLRRTEILCVALGCFTGAAIMLSLFAYRRVLVIYLSQSVGSAHNIAGASLQAIVIGDSVAVSRVPMMLQNLVPWHAASRIAEDASILPILAWLGIALIVGWRTGRGTNVRVAAVGVIGTALVTYGMLLAGHYPFYYTWMGAVPSLIAFAMCCERSIAARERLLAALALCAAGASVWLGFPSAFLDETREREPARYPSAVRLIEFGTVPADVIYGDPLVYYPAKQKGLTIYTTMYAGGRGYPRMTDAERASISLLLLEREGLDRELAKIGGAWTETRCAGATAPVLVMLRRPGALLPPGCVFANAAHGRSAASRRLSRVA